MSETTIVHGLVDRGATPGRNDEVRTLITHVERMRAPKGYSQLEVMGGQVFSPDRVKALSAGILEPAEVAGADAHIDKIGMVLSADMTMLTGDLDNAVPGVTPPATLRQICETSLMSSPRIWAEYSGLPDPAKKDFLARVMKQDGKFQKALMGGYAELTDPAALAAASGGVESAAVRAERARLQTEITADQARITAINGQLATLTTQISAFESSFDLAGNIVPGAQGLALTNLARDEAGYRSRIDLLTQGINPLQVEIDSLKRKRDTYFGRTVKDVTNLRTTNISGVDPKGNPVVIGRDEKRSVDYFADPGDTTSGAYGTLDTEIRAKEAELKSRKDDIVGISQQLARVEESRRQLQETHSKLDAERTRLQGAKTAAEAALAPKQARIAELGTAGETVATAYKDRLYSIIPQAFQTTINEQLAELSLAQDQIDKDRLERSVTTNANNITSELYKFGRTPTGERNHAVVLTHWNTLMTTGPDYLDSMMDTLFTPQIVAELQKDPDSYTAVRTDLLKKMYRYRTEYVPPVTPSTGRFLDNLRFKMETQAAQKGVPIPEAELLRFVDLAGEQTLRSGLANPGVQRALSELTGSAQLDPSLPLEDQLRGKKGADLQAILSILFLVGGASLLTLLGGRP